MSVIQSNNKRMHVSRKATGLITHLSRRPRVRFLQAGVPPRFYVPDHHSFRKPEQDAAGLEAHVQDASAGRVNGDRVLPLPQCRSASASIPVCLEFYIKHEHPGQHGRRPGVRRDFVIAMSALRYEISMWNELTSTTQAVWFHSDARVRFSPSHHFSPQHH